MKFRYQARSRAGEIQTGTIEASSREAALTLLQRHQLFVTLLEEEMAVVSLWARKFQLFGGISKKDIVTFSRQLSMLFQSQIPLLEALNALAKQTRKISFKEKILEISEEVEGGTPLSQALSHFPKLFSTFYISMVRSGEASGTLAESLNYIADNLEKQYYFSSKIQGAMIYPALVVVVVIAVLIMMMLFVIPNLAKVLTETGQELPTLTKMVIGLSNFIRGWGWLMFLASAAISFWAFRYYLGTSEGKKNLDIFILKVPMFGGFMKIIYVSRFAENLSTLIKGGLPIARALEISSDVVGNYAYQKIINEIKEEVRRGEKISSILDKYPNEIPPLVTQMVNVGERTGTIDKSLANVVGFYQKEIDRSVDNLLSILEPVLVIFLGLVVAGLMAAVLMPLYQITTV